MRLLLTSIILAVCVNFSVQQYASDAEIVARTILREAEGFTAGYNAVSWVIYNRVVSSSFPSSPKSVCLQNGQFAVWKSYWGLTNIPLNSASTSHKDYPYCLSLANNIMKNTKPTSSDPTGGAIFFLTDSPSVRAAHPNGIAIAGNWFFKTW